MKTNMGTVCVCAFHVFRSPVVSFRSHVCVCVYMCLPATFAAWYSKKNGLRSTTKFNSFEQQRQQQRPIVAANDDGDENVNWKKGTFMTLWYIVQSHTHKHAYYMCMLCIYSWQNPTYFISQAIWVCVYVRVCCAMCAYMSFSHNFQPIHFICFLWEI